MTKISSQELKAQLTTSTAKGNAETLGALGTEWNVTISEYNTAGKVTVTPGFTLAKLDADKSEATSWNLSGAGATLDAAVTKLALNFQEGALSSTAIIVNPGVDSKVFTFDKETHQIVPGVPAKTSEAASPSAPDNTLTTEEKVAATLFPDTKAAFNALAALGANWTVLGVERVVSLADQPQTLTDREGGSYKNPLKSSGEMYVAADISVKEPGGELQPVGSVWAKTLDDGVTSLKDELTKAASKKGAVIVVNAGGADEAEFTYNKKTDTFARKAPAV